MRSQVEKKSYAKSSAVEEVDSLDQDESGPQLSRVDSLNQCSSHLVEHYN